MSYVTAIPHYCIIRAKRSLLGFLRVWYWGGFVFFNTFFREMMRRIDTVFALKITIRNFFVPLYNDRTILGYILGVVLRSARIIVSVPIYVCVWVISVGCALVWMGIPLFLVYKVIVSI
jgi:hypothetical protein